MRRILTLLVLAAIVVAVPAVRSRIKGGLVTVEALGGPLRPLSWTVPPPREREVRLRRTRADLYTARGFSHRAGIVLVHGANPGGKDDPRVVALARAIARTGRRVLVPQLELRHERLDPSDRDRIVDAVERMAPGGSVGVLAFSYGAALTLVGLAERAHVQDEVRFVATVGTYYDVLHVVQGVTTGTVPYGDRDVEWTQADPRGRDVLVEQMAFLLGPRDGPSLRGAWTRRDASDLSPGTRAAYDLVSNRDPDRFDALVERLPPGIRRVAEDLSPSTVVDQIRVPVFALHARDDPASPPTESRLLVGRLRRSGEAKLVETGILRHVSPTASALRSLREAMRIAGFAGDVIRAHEGWPRP